MKAFFLFAFLQTTFCTQFIFQNNCQDLISVTRIDSGSTPFPQADVGSGGQATAEFDTGTMSFLVGDNGKTQAEFTINVDSRDFYDLNIIDGFDIGTQISSDNGPSLTCTDANCPDAYRNPTDNSQVGDVPTGGTFTITYCP